MKTKEELQELYNKARRVQQGNLKDYHIFEEILTLTPEEIVTQLEGEKSFLTFALYYMGNLKVIKPFTPREWLPVADIVEKFIADADARLGEDWEHQWEDYKTFKATIREAAALKKLREMPNLRFKYYEKRGITYVV